MRGVMVAGIAVGVLALAACNNVTAGTPMADPDQTGITTTTTTTTRSTSPTWMPLPPPVSTGTPAPGGAATPPPNGMATTCSEYSTMDDATKRGMVDLLGDNGYPGMKRNPLLWTSFIGTMCVIAPPGSTVVDAINNKVPG
ncbi:hypothetical protein [Mycolicibacterium mageritense]|uniref:DUF732 domain-containing protein n=1 Tax=Mycolicibacterium mageritense TaxID=53462 RepID=A0AAI8XNZ1_MYCME|nr:hypothetical protein [Mycolicibacterium mageritense]BDY29425.1 hypothetical protein hbim_03363 [Mycolicibacterium mageritense]